MSENPAPKVRTALLGSLRALAARLPALSRVFSRLMVPAMFLAHAMVLVAIAGMVLVPALVKGFLSHEASRAINRQISLESLRVNPFTGEMRASGFRIMNREGSGTLAGFSRLQVDLAPVALLGRRIKVERFQLEDPVLNLVRDASGALDIADLLPAPAARAPGREASSRPLELVPPGWHYSLSNISVTGGAVTLDDARIGQRQEARDLRFSIGSLTSDQIGLHEIFTTGGELNESELTIAVKGDLHGENPEIEARLNARNLVFRHYVPYLASFARPLDLTMDEAGLLVRVALARQGTNRTAPLAQGDVKLSGVWLKRGEERVAGCETLEAQGGAFDPNTPGVSLERLEIVSPLARVIRDQAGIIDLVAMLAAEPSQGGGTRGPAGAPLRVRVGEAVVRNGQVELDDQGLGLAVSLTGVQARLDGLDTGSGGFASLSLEAAGDRFAKFSASAKGSYAPLSLSVDWAIENADLAKPMPALARLLPGFVLSGLASAKGACSLEEKDGRLAVRMKADLTARQVRAKASKQERPLLEAQELSLAGVQADTAARSVAVERVALSGGGAALDRDESGRFPALPVPAAPGPGEGGAAAAPWSVSVGQAVLSKFALEYRDAKAQAAPRVDLEEFTLRGLSTNLASPVEVLGKGSLDGQTPFELSGEVRPGEPGAKLQATVSGLRLTELVKLAPPLPVSVLDGQASLSGQVSAGFGQGGISAAFSGDLGASGLALASPGQDKPFARLTGLALKGVSFTLSPLSVSAASLTLDEPWLALTLDKAGRPVLPFAVPAQAQQATGTQGGTMPASPAAVPINLGRLEVRQGGIDVTAEGFDPPLSGTISSIQADLEGVALGEPVKVVLGLRLGRTGSLKADGRAGLVSGEPLLDLKAEVADIDLNELSPVCQKFTGFPIVTGRFSLKGDYKADARSLDFKNAVEVSGVKLGRKAVLPGGGEEPLDLAVSLLTNSKGVIVLDIPVKGDWSRAKAGLGEVVAAAVTGMIGKIFLSPLAFLNVSQGTGSTAYVGFVPGQAELTPEGKKTLDALGRAIADRPKLGLSVMAYADPGSETESFAQALTLAAGKAAQAAAPAGPPRSALTGGPPEGARPGKRPGPEPAAPPGQAASSQQVQQVRPTLEDWYRLAKRRQEAVMAYLTGPGGLAKERVVPATGNVLGPPAVKGQPQARADVSLRY